MRTSSKEEKNTSIDIYFRPQFVAYAQLCIRVRSVVFTTFECGRRESYRIEGETFFSLLPSFIRSASVEPSAKFPLDQSSLVPIITC